MTYNNNNQKTSVINIFIYSLSLIYQTYLIDTTKFIVRIVLQKI